MVQGPEARPAVLRESLGEGEPMRWHGVIPGSPITVELVVDDNEENWPALRRLVGRQVVITVMALNPQPRPEAVYEPPPAPRPEPPLAQ